VGGRVLQFAGAEYMVRGRGYLTSRRDLENIVLATTDTGTPVRVRDVGEVAFGPDERRGATDLDGAGEAVSGIVIMREGENAFDVIARVKDKLRAIQAGLPGGVTVQPIYDRSELIGKSIDTLRSTLVEIMLTVVLVIMLFLWHAPSALVPVLTIPIAVLIAFVPFRFLGLSANIMSLGGIAIAVGALVDASIVVVEQTHKKLELWQQGASRVWYGRVVIDAIKEVGAPAFFALLVIAVSFLPVLTLEAQEGRLFKPLAYTKSLTMIVAAILAVTLDPALRMLFTRRDAFVSGPRWLRTAANAVLIGRIRSEETHPISRALVKIYRPVAAWSLRQPLVTIGIACLMLLATIPIVRSLGSEFMPPLDEGTLLYMPSTKPGISIDNAQKLLQTTDRILKQFPEVDRVLGKVGRAATPTDPAPLSMLETVITLKPTSMWRKVDTWYSGWAPAWAAAVFRHVTPDHISQEALVREMDDALQIPGVANAWTMPIQARTAMLTTGMRTPVGLKITAGNLQTIDEVGARVEAVLRGVPGTRSVFADRGNAGYFLDIAWKREELARFGLSIDDAQAIVQNAIGGENVTTVIEGQERYPVNVRYMPDFRSEIGDLGRLLVPASGQRQVPLAHLATIATATGPAMVRNDDGLLTGYVYLDIADRDVRGYVEDATRALAAIQLPAGAAIAWSGQYEEMVRARERLLVVVPLTLVVIALLLYVNTRSIARTSLILLAVPFSAIGAFWLLYLLGYHMSVGVWVGLIALLGVDAETGVFMLLYLDLAYTEAMRNGRLRTRSDLRDVVLEGAVKRLRPKFMTVATMIVGLVPIMLSTGTGADVMKRIAAPLLGGIITSFLLELLVYPPLFQIWKWHTEVRRQAAS
jgi:Cu(I)/Ag(I) efflux system membrane protein CusA/SilA